MTGGFRGAGRELGVAAGLVIALAAAAWVLFGAATSSIFVLYLAVISLIVLRTLISRPTKSTEEPETTSYDVPAVSFAGFWRTQTDLAFAVTSLSAWDNNSRRRLQNLLAARLSERHDISLAGDPQAAKAAFIGDRASREELWYWIDPQRLTPDDAQSRRGIPPRALSALIHRLEQL